MITEAQQYRIHMGDEAAFAEVFHATNLQVYHRALAALHDRRAAKAVVIEAFTAFRAALKTAEGPLDADNLLYTLTEDAVGKVDTLMRQPPAQAVEPEIATQPAAEPTEAASSATEPAEAASAAIAPAISEPSPEAHEVIRLATELDFDPEKDEIRYDGRPYKKSSPLPRIIIGLVLAVLFAWLLLGALMRGGAIPVRDLGYGWFNEHIYNLFPMGV